MSAFSRYFPSCSLPSSRILTSLPLPLLSLVCTVVLRDGKVPAPFSVSRERSAEEIEGMWNLLCPLEVQTE